MLRLFEKHCVKVENSNCRRRNPKRIIDSTFFYDFHPLISELNCLWFYGLVCTVTLRQDSSSPDDMANVPLDFEPFSSFYYLNALESKTCRQPRYVWNAKSFKWNHRTVPYKIKLKKLKIAYTCYCGQTTTAGFFCSTGNFNGLNSKTTSC